MERTGAEFHGGHGLSYASTGKHALRDSVLDLSIIRKINTVS
jgi:hypothetical protein